MNDTIKMKLSLLPDKPGCYLMKDKNNKVIYVGKAKVLKNRVRSYFTGAHNAKTTALVSEIEDLEYIITSSNKEAFLLEINLIKEYSPKYNILLKDDKTYPYIALTNEKHPRLYVTRAIKKSPNIKYYGPYPNVKATRSTCELLNATFPLRKCKNIPNKFCLYYHMHQCLGPCEIKEDFDYTPYIKKINNFLNGDIGFIIDDLKQKMEDYSKALNFEKALEMRDLINDIKATIDKQKISVSSNLSADFIGIAKDEVNCAIHILIMRNGKIIGNETEIIPIYTDLEDVITSYMLQYYKDIAPKNIYISQLDNILELNEILDTNIHIPQRGEKLEILNMANINANKDLYNRFHIHENRALKKIDTVKELGNILGINTPYYIESFDNSNLYGEYPISAMVVYRNGQPSKSEFRKYHIKTVVGANDYESMKEVVYRRYFRLLSEGKEYPDLILMDGGQIQVNACKEVLESLHINIPVAGIQKDDYHKAALLYYEGNKIKLSKNSDVYLLLYNISQTVHDFAIRFFRSEHVKGLYTSKLDSVKGLGKARKEKLLKHYVRLENIKNAPIEEIHSLGIPLDVCQRLKDMLDGGDEVDS